MRCVPRICSYQVPRQSSRASLLSYRLVACAHLSLVLSLRATSCRQVLQQKSRGQRIVCMPYMYVGCWQQRCWSCGVRSSPASSWRKLELSIARMCRTWGTFLVILGMSALSAPGVCVCRWRPEREREEKERERREREKRERERERLREESEREERERESERARERESERARERERESQRECV